MTYGSSSRIRLTLQHKLDICAAIESGVHYNALITKYQVGKITITIIRKDSANIRKFSEAAGTTTLDKTVRKAKFSAFEAILMRFFKLCRQIKQPVTLATLSYRELKRRDDLLKTDLSDKEKEELVSFRAPKTWYIK